MRSWYQYHYLTWTIPWVLAGCIISNTSDIGTPCIQQNVPTLTKDSNFFTSYALLTSDIDCEALLCASAYGLNPFCTSNCNATLMTTPASCLTHQDCSTGKKFAKMAQCINGLCYQDSCPTGYWCRAPALLSAGGYCLRQNSCVQDSDCGHGFHCIAYACFDPCLNSNSNTTTCNMQCLSDAEAGCLCGSSFCGDGAMLSCQTPQNPNYTAQRLTLCQPY